MPANNILQRLINQIPPVTRWILAINIAVHAGLHWMLPLVSGWGALESALYTVGLVPTAFWQGAVWQPVTSTFVHGFFLHLLVNMIGVASIGTLLERRISSRLYAILYALSALGGSFFVLAFQYRLSVPTVGASGALMGLLGALAVLQPNARLLLFFFPVRARTAAIGAAAVSLLLALIDGGPGISHLGHLGGIVFGAAYTFFAFRSIIPHASNLNGSFGFDWYGDDKNASAQNYPYGTHHRRPEQDANVMMEQILSRLFAMQGPAYRQSQKQRPVNPPRERRLVYDPWTGHYVVRD
ncbi:MAG: rhomboid family intramembrane serine protease [Leptospiraceae bacterium]|nr:rhomboid family intramembrane serine protease [Leptospiraceae bacterium]